MLRPDVALSLPCWLSQFSFTAKNGPHQILIPAVYYVKIKTHHFCFFTKFGCKLIYNSQHSKSSPNQKICRPCRQKHQMKSRDAIFVNGFNPIVRQGSGGNKPENPFSRTTRQHNVHQRRTADWLPLNTGTVAFLVDCCPKTVRPFWPLLMGSSDQTPNPWILNLLLFFSPKFSKALTK